MKYEIKKGFLRSSIKEDYFITSGQLVQKLKLNNIE